MESDKAINRAKILVVDDESSIRITLREFLKDKGYEVEVAEDADVAKGILTKKEFDIVLVDIIMPRITGVNLLKSIKGTSPRIQVIMMTGEPTVETASEAVRAGAFDYMTKPINKEHLLKIVSNAVKIKLIDDERRRLAKENRHYQENLERLVEERTIELQNEIAEHKQAEKELRKLSAAIEQSPVSVVITDKEGNIEYVNPKFCKLTGYSLEEVFGENPRILNSGLMPKEIYKQLWKTVLSGKVWHGEFHNKKKNGKLYWEDAVISPIIDRNGEITNLLSVKEDITERKQIEEDKYKLEAQLRRAQKLETIGTLAGGIAHDFNNILTPILGYTDMAIAELPEADPLKQNLNRVLEGAHRAKDLIEQILLFSKQIEKKRIPLSLHLILKEALQLLRSSIPTTVDIVQRIDSSCDKVLADATQIHQVIINLCTNAWHAMEKNGGTLTVELKQVEVDAANAELHPNLNIAEYVRLTVQDTGQGMDEDTLDRLFEPFFTTKSVDMGTGLGLSVVHGIVHNHKGEILVYSEPGKGSVFHIYLPIVKTDGKDKEVKREKSLSGSESIIIVDDDKVIGNMLSQMLEKLGYKVYLYNKSKEVLSHFQNSPDEYNLLISDLTMPEFTGIDLSEQIQKIQPGFPIIIMTGYGDTLMNVDQKSHGIKKVLQKPIVMKDLAHAIREVLEK